ncbi:hypothetical protein DM01DRAFT_1301634 [Hesseltinella vesiculosa]|uniref:NUDE domain-containing protein n=1 Tax=Hesseltinella vesiculosa TaxID=101127 RepID=A0A1X2GQE0_9FUNG|nr:hypothetical protein DM01DRAFT_1301634 [Hesseltinella vesiculosa]
MTDNNSMSSRIVQFNSVQDELDYYRSHAEDLEITLQETRAALDEFQISSRELEEELEKELQTTEKAYKDLKAICERSKRDADEWKAKYTGAKHEQSLTMMQMQREIDILRATEERFRKNILELELDNDDLERTERAATSSLADLEVKLNKAIERNVILENEIATKDNLMEQTQRLRDELNEVNQELGVLRQKYDKQEAHAQTLESQLDQAEKLNRRQELQLRRLQQDDTIPRHAHGSSSPIPANAMLSSTSNPVKMVQEMVSRVRSLESRLQSCRSLVTPLLNPPPSYSTAVPHSPVLHTNLGGPLHLSNIHARRPSEYMTTSTDE